MSVDTVAPQLGQDSAIWMLGGLYVVKASSAQTGGALTVMEKTIPAGMGPPPHTFRGSESIYVLDGTLRYHIADQTHDGGAGTFYTVPEGVLTYFEATSELRVLVLYTPGGIEQFFAQAGQLADRRELPPAPTAPPDIPRLVELGARYGMDIKLADDAARG